jgi:hypothetical protein
LRVGEDTLISEQVDVLGFELAFGVPGVPDVPDAFEVVPLAVPCIVGEEESIPGETKQKGGQVVVLSKRYACCTPQGA